LIFGGKEMGKRRWLPCQPGPQDMILLRGANPQATRQQQASDFPREIAQ
jgi:hypothetical protein